MRSDCILLFDRISKYFIRFFWMLFLCNSSISILLFNPETSPWLNFSDKSSFSSSLIIQWFEKSGVVHWFIFGSLQYLAIALVWSSLILIVTHLRTKKIILYSLLFFVSTAELSGEYPFSLFIDQLGQVGTYIYYYATYFFDQPYRIIIFSLIGIITLLKIFNYSFLQITGMFLRTSFTFCRYGLLYTWQSIKKLLSWLLSSLMKFKKGDGSNNNNPATEPSIPKKKKSFFSSTNRTYSLAHCFKKNISKTKIDQLQHEETARILEETLAFFNINGQVENIYAGPVVTLFEYGPELGSKISKIIALEHDLALKLKAPSIRIIAPIPGKSVVGFEIANHHREIVYFGNIISDKNIDFTEYQIPLIIGANIMGHSMVIDLPSTPHLLIAGSTGSGKSVGMHSIVASIIALHKPDLVKLIMIDPKRLEFSYYNDIPHLLLPLINDASKAISALKWLVKEMERRYIILSKKSVRNISDYHAAHPGSEEEMPFIVLLIDELADLMMVAGKEIETELARLAQMARAAGIFLIVATQRPSVDVLTGLIKVNFPSRIAYRVTSKIDSRTILDQMGAEKLLGKGDLLLLHSTATTLQRIHGAFLSNKEIIRLADAARKYGKPEYIILKEESSFNKDADSFADDPLYETIKDFILTVDEVSISMIQRQYRIGFNRSARIVDLLEKEGYVGSAQGSKPRKVL